MRYIQQGTIDWDAVPFANGYSFGVCACVQHAVVMAKAEHMRENQWNIFCTLKLCFSLILDRVEIRLTVFARWLDDSKISEKRKERVKLCAKTHGWVQPCAHLFSAMLNAIYDTIIYQTLKKYRINYQSSIGRRREIQVVVCGQTCTLYALMCLYVYLY